MMRMLPLLGLVSLLALPSCAHPLDRVMEARAMERQGRLEATGQVSRGACDDVGQFIARDQVTAARGGLSVMMEASAAPTR